MTAVLARVELTDRTGDEYPGWLVQPVWAGVDRPVTSGWLVKDRRTALRLESAILAGAAVSDPTVEVDVNGSTYVACRHHVLGRMMNADLRRLGF